MIIHILTALFLLTVTCFGATNYVHDLSYTNVQAQVNAASAGDWIVLTNGNVGWTNTVTITNGITIAALTNSATVITNIQNDAYSGVFKWYPSLSNLVGRITGFHFELLKQSAGIYVHDGLVNRTQVRIDHCIFNQANSRAIYVSGVVYGVSDHNTFINCRKVNDVYYSIPLQDWSWEQGYTMGSTNAYFIEDNIIIYNGDMDGTLAGVTSAQNGARYIFRNNVISNTAPAVSLDSLDAHGNQHIPYTSDDLRGTVSFEIYSNIIYSIQGYRHIVIRGGSGVIYSNVMSDEGMEYGIYMYEEDGPARFNYVTNPPAYDPVTNVYIWENTFGGADATVHVGSTSTNFIQENRDYFMYSPTSYVAAVYPHPLVDSSETDEEPEIPEEPEDPPASGYAYSSTAFNGTNQFMQNTNEFVAPITNSFTLSFWIRRNGGAGTVQQIYSARDSTQSRFSVSLTTGNKIYIYAKDEGATTVLSVTSATSIPVDTNWHHVYCSVDLTSTNNRCMVINGSLDSSTWAIYIVDEIIDFTTANTYFGAVYTPASYLFAEVTEFWLDVNSGFLFWEDNLGSFASRDENEPVYLGDNGELPTGTTPDLYLKLDFDSPMVDSSGSGNDFDVTYNGPLAGTNYNAETVTATVTISDLEQTFDGSEKSVTVTTIPYGLDYTLTYDGSATVPTNAGSYMVVATVTESGYQGGDTNTLVIDKATPTVSAWPTAAGIIYGQTLSSATLTGGSASVAGSFTWDDDTVAPSIGTTSYPVTFTPTDTTNYETDGGTVNVTTTFTVESAVTLTNFARGNYSVTNLQSASYVPAGSTNTDYHATIDARQYDNLGVSVTCASTAYGEATATVNFAGSLDGYAWSDSPVWSVSIPVSGITNKTTVTNLSLGGIGFVRLHSIVTPATHGVTNLSMGYARKVVYRPFAAP